MITVAIVKEVNETELVATWTPSDIEVKVGDWIGVECKEQPAQEPVGFDAYSCDEGDYWHDCPDDIDIVDGRKLGEEFELLCAYQSHVMKFKITKVPDDVDDDYEVECIDEMPKLYTHPAPSWQGLNGDEIEALALDNDVISVISQVEAKLKDKNHGQ